MHGAKSEIQGVSRALTALINVSCLLDVIFFRCERLVLCAGPASDVDLNKEERSSDTHNVFK
jgi:hypothetical protein